jgi:hypothetical protein
MNHLHNYQHLNLKPLVSRKFNHAHHSLINININNNNYNNVNNINYNTNNINYNTNSYE